MICKVCGGIGGASGSGGAWGSRAVKELSNELGRTCFCGISLQEIQSLMETFENKLEVFLMANFPGKSMDDIREELRTMERQSNLRVHAAKRLQYRERLKEEFRKRKKIVEEQQKKKEEGSPGISRMRRLASKVPKDEGEGMSNFAKESEY